MIDQELCHLTASEALHRFARLELSPVELLEALCARADEVEPVVNAFGSLYLEQAFAAARASEARWARRDGSAGALDGLALAVKENTDSSVAGTISTDGNLWRADAVDRHTSPSIERLLEAGAFVHARTTMPEFGWAWTCVTRLRGTTRNPWNPAYTSGGSSSGSAAAIAAGTATIATATDALGSLRHPCAMCGVVGFKPPYGRNPLNPGVNFDFFKHLGPVTRSVGDAVLLQNVMSGQHPLDHATVAERLTVPWPLDDLAGLCIAYSLDLDAFPVTSAVRAATREALGALRDAGATVTEVDMGWAYEVMRAAARYVDRLYGDLFESALVEHPDEICDYTAYYAESAGKISPADCRAALDRAGWAWRAHFGPLLERFDAFVCPTLAFHHVPAEQKPWQRDLEVEGALYTDHDAVMTGLFNLYSRCPVLVVPSGFTDEGLPTSLQIAARPFDDTTAFRIGAALERRRPWLDVPARRPEPARFDGSTRRRAPVAG